MPVPSLKKGWEIFASRSISLVSLLVLSIVVCIISFLILTFPVITGFYYAISQSRKEEYFIDLNNIFRTISFFFQGIKRYFFQSYILGCLGLIPPIILVLLPVLALEHAGKDYLLLGILLQVLWLPAFFLIGSVLLYGYPFLLASKNGFQALQYAIFNGKNKVFLVLAIGFFVTFPIPGMLFHLLMVFSYPILVSSSVASTADLEEDLLKIPKKIQVQKIWKGFYFLLPVVFILGFYYSYQTWDGAGIIAWLGLSFAFFIVTKMTSLGFAVKLFGFVFGFTGLLIGGMVLIAKQWNETAGMIWVAFCIIFLVFIQRKLRKAFRTDAENEVDEIADQFIEVVTEKEQKKGSMIIGCIGFIVLLVSLVVLVGTLGKTIGGILWIGLISLTVFILSFFYK